LERGLEAASLFGEASPSDRLRVVESVSSDLRKKLLAISGFMAEEALNDGSERWIEGAVVMHVIEGFDDYRENFRHLALVNFAADRIGVRLEDVIDRVGKIGTARSSGYLGGFCRRDRSLNGLGSFGMRVEQVGDRWRFVPA
jgi:hypothetical protein